MIGLILEFQGVGKEKYDAVMRELGLDKKNAHWPRGVISHFAGPVPGGWCVVDLWESQQAFDTFRERQLQPAFQKVGGIPKPEIKTVPIHLSHIVPSMAGVQ